jgi:hypothetical protein
MMFLRNALLFIIVCGVTGPCILLGSILGNAAGKTGLFAGAVVGGIIGVGLAVWLAGRVGLLERTSLTIAFLGGVIGFLIAAVIAVNNLGGPIIPIASISVIGLAVLVSKRISEKRTGR